MPETFLECTRIYVHASAYPFKTVLRFKELFDKEQSDEPIREESDELVALDRVDWKNDWREY